MGFYYSTWALWAMVATFVLHLLPEYPVTPAPPTTKGTIRPRPFVATQKSLSWKVLKLKSNRKTQKQDHLKTAMKKKRDVFDVDLVEASILSQVKLLLKGPLQAKMQKRCRRNNKNHIKSSIPKRFLENNRPVSLEISMKTKKDLAKNMLFLASTPKKSMLPMFFLLEKNDKTANEPKVEKPGLLVTACPKINTKPEVEKPGILDRSNINVKTKVEKPGLFFLFEKVDKTTIKPKVEKTGCCSKINTKPKEGKPGVLDSSKINVIPKVEKPELLATDRAKINGKPKVERPGLLVRNRSKTNVDAGTLKQKKVDCVRSVQNSTKDKVENTTTEKPSEYKKAKEKMAGKTGKKRSIQGIFNDSYSTIELTTEYLENLKSKTKKETTTSLEPLVQNTEVSTAAKISTIIKIDSTTEKDIVTEKITITDSLITNYIKNHYHKTNLVINLEDEPMEKSITKQKIARGSILSKMEQKNRVPLKILNKVYSKGSEKRLPQEYKILNKMKKDDQAVFQSYKDNGVVNFNVKNRNPAFRYYL